MAIGVALLVRAAEAFGVGDAATSRSFREVLKRFVVRGFTLIRTRGGDACRRIAAFRSAMVLHLSFNSQLRAPPASR